MCNFYLSDKIKSRQTSTMLAISYIPIDQSLLKVAKSHTNCKIDDSFERRFLQIRTQSQRQKRPIDLIWGYF